MHAKLLHQHLRFIQHFVLTVYNLLLLRNSFLKIRVITQ